MEELNQFAQNAITYDDDRPQSVSLSTENKYIALNSTTQTFTLPVGITINSASSVSYSGTYDVDVGTTNATVDWAVLPTSDFSESVPSTGLYRVTGPMLPSYWDDFNAPTVTYPGGYTTNNTIDVTLTYPGTGGDTVVSEVDVIWPLANSFSYSTGDTSNFADGFNVTMPVEGFNNTTINTSNVSVSIGNLSTGNTATITSSTVTQDGLNANVNIQGSIGWEDWLTVTSIPVTVSYDGVSEDKSILLHAEQLTSWTEDNSGSGASFKYYHFTADHYASGVAAGYVTTLDILGTWSNLVGFTNKIMVADGFLDYNQVLALTDGGVGGSLGAGAYQKIYDSGISTSSYPVTISTADGNWGSIQRPPALIQHEFTVVVDWGTGNPQPTGSLQLKLANLTEIANVTERTRGLY